MQIASELQHRTLAFVAACNGSGYDHDTQLAYAVGSEAIMICGLHGLPGGKNPAPWADRGRSTVTARPKLHAAFGAAAVIVTAALVACGSSSPSHADGPFGPSGGAVENAECIPIPGWIITYGFEAVRNTGSSDATIQKIGYVHPHNLQVLDTFVVPVHGISLYGGITGYPPKWLLAERSRTVPPTRGNAADDYSNVILVTKLTGRIGHADAVYVDYKENGVLYYYRTITSLTVKHGGRCT